MLLNAHVLILAWQFLNDLFYCIIRYNEITGILLNSDEVYNRFPPKLSVSIGHLHVTLVYHGGIESAHEELLGEEVKIRVIGYANDGKNEALQVELEATNPELQMICKAVVVPHITLSISRDSKHRFSKDLNFEPIDNSIEFMGRYGVFTRSGLVLYN